MKIVRAALFVLGFALLFAVTPAEATIFHFEAFLSGPNESPPNPSPGNGGALVDFDDVLNTMHVHVDFSGLLGTSTALYIQSATTVAGTGTASIATTTPTLVGFPIGVTSGTYDKTLDMTLASSYNPAFVTANGGTTASAEAALLAGITAGKAYVNIASTIIPGGEIRGFLTPVPEPSTLALLGIGAGALVVAARRNRRKPTV